MPAKFLLLSLLLLGTAATGSGAELHTFHCLGGCPVGAPATNDTIVREIYTLSSNDLTKMADWVAYRVTPASIGPSGARQWQPDPWLEPDERLSVGSYDGAPAALRIDRGHQAPLASFSGTPQADETNILSNITPQASALNQGPWARLEDEERALTGRLQEPVYVYTGPLFERPMKPLPGGGDYHRVPSGYWKIVALQDGRVSAFLFDQNTPRSSSHCDARVSVLDVELRSRLRLMPDFSERDFAPLDAELGCAGPTPPPSAPSEITTR
ncbi:DNA/RNA non-specific endonuclease [Sphingosinicella sp. BN140058]|uniref:DNA/RNA non-specific endonuclease n=1 Tax=Sphingosinicella sp. BN140058 TaxID=1892855 RepID=UPI0013EC012E|nr:DNA/RNA non-specific endonuclease [Sphingosinicella sp. BN140058]